MVTDLTKILAENQTQIVKLIDRNVKKRQIPLHLEGSDSETENTQPASISTLIKSKATTSKNTPVTSRNNFHKHQDQSRDIKEF